MACPAQHPWLLVPPRCRRAADASRARWNVAATKACGPKRWTRPAARFCGGGGPLQSSAHAAHGCGCVRLRRCGEWHAPDSATRTSRALVAYQRGDAGAAARGCGCGSAGVRQDTRMANGSPLRRTPTGLPPQPAAQHPMPPCRHRALPSAPHRCRRAAAAGDMSSKAVPRMERRGRMNTEGQSGQAGPWHQDGSKGDEVLRAEELGCGAARGEGSAAYGRDRGRKPAQSWSCSAGRWGKSAKERERPYLQQRSNWMHTEAIRFISPAATRDATTHATDQGQSRRLHRDLEKDVEGGEARRGTGPFAVSTGL